MTGAGSTMRRFDSVRAIAQSLLGYGLSAEKPLALLSGNDIEHLQVALGAMYASIPYCPVSPAYSLLSQDFAKLRHVCNLLQPGLVFVSDAAAYQRAIDVVLPGRNTADHRARPNSWLQSGDLCQSAGTARRCRGR